MEREAGSTEAAGLGGLVESVADFLPEARYQCCMVHFYRNVFSHVPSTRVREVSPMLKAIHAQESREAADNKAKAIVDDLRASRMGKAADLVEQAVHETMTYYSFPDIHWQKIRTNNPLERIMKEIRRRTRVVGAFPDGQSCLNLAAARLQKLATDAVCQSAFKFGSDSLLVQFGGCLAL
jgi:putative transposase